MTERTAISGFVKPRFEAVQEAFVENFERQHELGAASCIYRHGEKLVDLWGGVRNKATRALSSRLGLMSSRISIQSTVGCEVSLM